MPGGGSQGGGIMGRGGGTPSQEMATGPPDTLHKRLSHTFQLLGLFFLGPELSVSSIFHRLNNGILAKIHSTHCSVITEEQMYGDWISIPL